MTYTHDERARARSVIRRLSILAGEARSAAARGIALPDAAERAIYGLTGTNDSSRQIDALNVLGERRRAEHLGRLKPLAHDEFNAFCEYVNPDEPPESPWHIWLTGMLQRVETEPGNERLVLNCPPGHAKPLSVHTLVQMADGSHKPLGEIVVGDQVITHLARARSITAVHEQGSLDVLKIVTKGGRKIIAAPDHSFAMQERHGLRPSPTMWREAGELRPGNNLILGKAKFIPNTSHRKSGMFELAAMVAAQGGRSYRQGKTRVFRNAYLLTTSDAIAARMQAHLVKMRIGFNHAVEKTDNLHVIRMATDDADWFADLLGLDESAHDRTIPEFVYHGGDAELRRYIKTYVDLTAELPKRFKYARMHLPFKSHALAHGFQRLLARFDVPARFVEGGGRNCKLVLEQAMIESYIAAGFSYDGVFAERLIKKRITTRKPLPVHTDEIASIRQHGQCECRCLMVEEDSSFIAEGVVVHNSTYASRLYVAWRMGRRPREKMIGGGHSQRFVENEFSKKIRDLVGSAAYHDIFPSVAINATTRAADQWAIAGTGGQYVAKGAGQAIHGYRANFVCVDDPYPQIEAAESPTIRESVATWFFGDIGSRLLPGATVFLVMTRFHEDDLTGSVIEANKALAPASRYKIIEAPAICYDPENDILGRAKGQVLWDYYSLEYFDVFRATWSYQRFSLVFQQLTSAADESSIASKLRFYKRPPHATDEAIAKARDTGAVDPTTGRPKIEKRDYYRRIVASVDTAAKTNERADYTVIQIWGETHDRKHYLLDQKRGKWELPEMTREINKLARRHGVDVILVEDKGQGTAYIQDQATTEFQRRKAPAPVVAIAVPANQGKVFRFDEITPIIEAGEVFVPELADWIDLFIREIGQFPDGAHDDQVDALSQYLRWMKTKRTRYGSKKVGSLG